MRNIDQCRKGYHEYTQLENNGDVIVSKCEICGKVIREHSGDNKKWLENHKRDFIQRGHKDYKMIYGDNKAYEKEQDPAWIEEQERLKREEREKDHHKWQF